MAVDIHSIRTQRLQVGMTRPIRMSFGEIREQHVMLVRIRDRDGIEGVGEACIMGGPFWNQECIEGAEAVVSRYAAPFLLGQSFDKLETFSGALHALFRGNGSARCALEMAFLDLQGKQTGRSAAELLGGAVRSSIPVAWTLSSRRIAEAIDDGEAAIAQRGHRMFKIKVGVSEPEDEIAFSAALTARFAGRAQLIIDANQAWSTRMARELLPRFRDAGVSAVEQPVAAHDVRAMAGLVRDGGITVIADEPLTSPGVAAMYAGESAASCFSLKPQRDGGLVDAGKTALIAHSAGLSCYGGTMLETSLGTAALCALYSTVPDLDFGCELFGPLRLEHDICVATLRPRDGALMVPHGPGLGVVLDEDRIEFLSRRSA